MFKQYQHIQTAELRPYIQNEDISNISISQTDKLNDSPKQGDMITRNPANHNDQWLVAEQYFKDNFVELPEIYDINEECDLKEISLKYLNHLLVGKKINVYVDDKDKPTDVSTHWSLPYEITTKVVEVGLDYDDYFFKLSMLDNPNRTVRLEVFSETFTLFD